MIKLGMCTSPDNAALAAQMGYDYIECAVTGIAAMSDEEFARVKAGVLATPIRMEAANVLMPADFRLTGGEADLSRVPAYLEGVLPRLAALGCQVVVFGSGKARSMPADFPREQALAQLVEFLRLAGDAFAAHGLRIAIEPLNTKECNVVNSVRQGLELANLANHPHVGVLADWYHIAVEQEGVEGILAAENKLWHTHIANPEGRLFPKENDSRRTYAVFFTALKEIGYDARLSVEGKGDLACEGAEALRTLQGYV